MKITIPHDELCKIIAEAVNEKIGRTVIPSVDVSFKQETGDMYFIEDGVIAEVNLVDRTKK